MNIRYTLYDSIIYIVRLYARLCALPGEKKAHRVYHRINMVGKPRERRWNNASSPLCLQLLRRLSCVIACARDTRTHIHTHTLSLSLSHSLARILAQSTRSCLRALRFFRFFARLSCPCIIRNCTTRLYSLEEAFFEDFFQRKCFKYIREI